MPLLEHIAIFGTPGYGKSEAAASINAPRMRQKNGPAFVVCDPHGPLAKRFATLATFYGKDFVYDSLREVKNCPGYEFFAPSYDPDPDKKEAEDREMISEAKSVILRAEGKVDASQNKIINRGLDDALNLLIHQREPCPFYWLKHCFNPLYEEHHAFLAGCTHPEYVIRFLWYAGLSDREREFHAGPAERRLEEICNSPQFRKRCLPTFNLPAYLNDGGMLILDGESKGDLSRQDATLIMGLVINKLIAWKRAGRIQRRVVLIIDEGVNAKLIDLNVSRALAEARKWGLEIILIFQNPLTIGLPEVQDNVFQTCSKIFFFRQVNPAATKYAAENCAIPNLDPYKLHSVESRTRLEHDGYDIEEIINTGVWESDGKSGTSTNKNIVTRAKYREKTEEFKKYHTLDDQVRMFQKEIATLAVGHCFIRSEKSVSAAPIYIPMETIRWDGLLYSRSPRIPLADHKLQEKLAALKSRLEYQTPVALAPCIPAKNVGNETPKSSGASTTQARFRKFSTSSKTAKKGSDTPKPIDE